jgi:uncharacterized protein (DUF1501 family)
MKTTLHNMNHVNHETMMNAPYVKSMNQSRRQFLKTAAKLSVAGGATPFAINLAGIGNAAAQTVTDYKALVCVFLFGANDHNNTVMPYDTANFNAYVASRAGLTRAQADMLPLDPATPLTGSNAGRQFALPKEMAPMKTLWDQGKLAIVANVGTLIFPLTKAQYQNRSVPLPPKLFSHNDQQSIWQASAPEGARYGWGGRIGDLFASQNSASVFTCNSVSGNSVFLAGQDVVSYQLSTSGSTAINGITGSLFGSSLASATLKNLITAGGYDLFSQDVADITRRSIDANVALSAALSTAPDLPLPAAAANNRLAQQLRIVARMIAQRAVLGSKRQVFFVSLGGFDTHDNQLTVQPGLHTQIADALAYFQASIDSLAVGNQVTTFTASDFGRTLNSNGDGSDHGWGSHHFVMGGAVRGRNYYGTFPIMGLNNADEVGSGRLLPTTSVDQYAATMARWFGVSDTNLPLVLPNIGNFGSSNLGFMA